MAAEPASPVAYDPDNMPMRRLGRTGLAVSALALGTVELGVDYGIQEPGHFGRPDEADAISLVHHALDCGINLVDTARAYGTSETVLGKALAGRRDRVVLATKVVTQSPDGSPLSPNDLRKAMDASLETSLRELQTDYVDIWQVHNVDRHLLANPEPMSACFDDAIRAGKVRFAGGSFYGADLPLESLSLDLFDVMQITYSVLDQRLTDHFYPRATEADIGIIARSVLLKGVLTARAEHLPSHLHPLRDRSRVLAEIIEQAGLGITRPQAAIAFVLAQPAIHSVLIGVRTAAELLANLSALDVELTPDLMLKVGSLRLDDEELLNPSTWGIP